MNGQKSSFSVNDRQYEVRVALEGDEVQVRAFVGDEPANGFRYCVTIENALNIKNLLGVDAVRELVRIAEDHVRRRL